jgi:hypothetical protein
LFVIYDRTYRAKEYGSIFSLTAFYQLDPKKKKYFVFTPAKLHTSSVKQAFGLA